MEGREPGAGDERFGSVWEPKGTTGLVCRMEKRVALPWEKVGRAVRMREWPRGREPGSLAWSFTHLLSPCPVPVRQPGETSPAYLGEAV